MKFIESRKQIQWKTFLLTTSINFLSLIEFPDLFVDSLPLTFLYEGMLERSSREVTSMHHVLKQLCSKTEVTWADMKWHLKAVRLVRIRTSHVTRGVRRFHVVIQTHEEPTAKLNIEFMLVRKK
jgi:hypothetical protein